MAFDPIQLTIGVGLAVLVALLARSAGSLSTSGSFAAILIGGITFGLGGPLPGTLLIAFFITSSILSRIGGTRKKHMAKAFAKGGERDHGQVFANGMVAAIFSIILAFLGEGFWLAGITGAFAAVNADTWSTELGVLAKSKPRLISTMKTVEPGTSGGMTLEGTLAGLAGAGLIALIAGIARSDPILLLAATFGGLSGATLDSFLGATVQVIYYCAFDEKETEQHPVHVCGNQTTYLRGWSWLSNDMVNFLASFLGSLVTIAIWHVLS